MVLLERPDGRSRHRLTDYFQLVYPASPVMLPATHLSSLTFHFCEGGPSALLAAISASIAQHLSDREAQKTLQEEAAVSLAESLGKKKRRKNTRRTASSSVASGCGVGGGYTVPTKRRRTMIMLMNGQQQEVMVPFSDDEEADGTEGEDELVGDPSGLTRLEVAAHHAASAEMLLLAAEEVLAAGSRTASGPGSPELGGGGGGGVEAGASQGSYGAAMTATFTTNLSTVSGYALSGPPPPTSSSSTKAFRVSTVDRQLMLIECIATRVLLAQYYYGQCGHRGHKQGYLHALRAWEMAQGLVLVPPVQAQSPGAGAEGAPAALGGEQQQLQKDAGSQVGLVAPAVMVGGPVPGGFSQAEKMEWSRRVYHACFSAVVVLATTGGF
ncbi:hypothetical protein OC835_004360, partial [Tilletia horrida]